MTKNQHGGPNRNQGRRYLNGSSPGKGEYLKRKTASLPPDMIDFLYRLGGNNFSAGVRIVTEAYQKAQEE